MRTFGDRLSRRVCLAACGAGVAAARGAGAADPYDDVRTFLNEQHAAAVFPGAALIGSINGKIRLETYLGVYHSLKSPSERVTREVIHPLYSFSKLVSATVVGIAVQEGKVEWSTPVRKFIPEFTGGGKDEITLRHLLTHSAGMPSVPLKQVHTREGWQAALNAMCAASTDWAPGSRTLYHGLTGLFTAAAVVLRAYGLESWDDLAREKLFRPIGARSLTFQLPRDEAHTALTPQPKGPVASLATHFGAAGHPAGGGFGTPRDALKVLQLHLNRGLWGDEQVVDAAVVDEMHRLQYAAQITAVRARGERPAHETWGLGPLLRGDGPPAGGHDWFGFRDRKDPGVFGHAGIDTVIGVAEPSTGKALFFVTTQSPPDSPRTIALRNGVSNRMLDALK